VELGGCQKEILPEWISDDLQFILHSICHNDLNEYIFQLAVNTLNMKQLLNECKEFRNCLHGPTGFLWQNIIVLPEFKAGSDIVAPILKEEKLYALVSFGNCWYNNGVPQNKVGKQNFKSDLREQYMENTTAEPLDIVSHNLITQVLDNINKRQVIILVELPKRSGNLPPLITCTGNTVTLTIDYRNIHQLVDKNSESYSSIMDVLAAQCPSNNQDIKNKKEEIRKKRNVSSSEDVPDTPGTLKKQKSVLDKEHQFVKYVLTKSEPELKKLYGIKDANAKKITVCQKAIIEEKIRYTIKDLPQIKGIVWDMIYEKSDETVYYGL